MHSIHAQQHVHAIASEARSVKRISAPNISKFSTPQRNAVALDTALVRKLGMNFISSAVMRDEDIAVHCALVLKDFGRGGASCRGVVAAVHQAGTGNSHLPFPISNV